MGIPEYLSASNSVGRDRHIGSASNASLPDHLLTGDFDTIKGYQKYHSRSPLQSADDRGTPKIDLEGMRNPF